MNNTSNGCFNEEIRCGYKVSSRMKKVWSYEIDLVKKLLFVCTKYNLKCWIDSGTLLGAIRHKGFIPWDDDIDLTMFRSDYDILVHEAAKEFKPPYFLQTAYSDKNYIHPHAQLRNINTAAILEGSIDRQYNQGIFIDIFVFDGVSNNSKVISRQEKKIHFYSELLRNTFYGKIKNYKHIFTKLLPRLIFRKNSNYIILFRKFEEELRKINIDNVDFVSRIGYYGHVEKCMDKHWYDDTILVDFESLKLPAPANYHEVLCVYYGDNYMTPIKQPSDHGSIIFDTERPSEVVLNELRKQIKQ